MVEEGGLGERGPREKKGRIATQFNNCLGAQDGSEIRDEGEESVKCAKHDQSSFLTHTSRPNELCLCMLSQLKGVAWLDSGAKESGWPLSSPPNFTVAHCAQQLGMPTRVEEPGAEPGGDCKPLRSWENVLVSNSDSSAVSERLPLSVGPGKGAASASDLKIKIYFAWFVMNEAFPPSIFQPCQLYSRDHFPDTSLCFIFLLMRVLPPL